jgi:hypothetical protein
MLKQAASLLLFLAITANATSPWSRNMANYLGDASMAWEYQRQATNNYLQVDVKLSEGTHDAITLTGWYSMSFTNFECYVVPQLFYTPDEVQLSNPDLLNGSLSHGVSGGTNLTGTFSFSGFTYSTYTNHPTITNTWKWGVYTLDGWSSNSLTINLGGIDYNVGPGTFNRNAIAGGSGDFIVTGTGLASIGVSKTPCHKFYSFSLLDTVTIEEFSGGISSTNGMGFWSIRIRADGTNQVATLDSKTNNKTWITAVAANSCSLKLSSQGIYKLSMVGLKNSANKAERLYDVRAYKWRLSDVELERVYNNGFDDKTRRGYN